MNQPELNSKQNYKIKLGSGRILGPFPLDRVRLLILRNQITGLEMARRYPQEDWVNINEIQEIAQLLVSKIEGRLTTNSKIQEARADQLKHGYTATAVLPGATAVLPGATKVLTSAGEFQPLPLEGEDPKIEPKSEPGIEIEEKTQMGVRVTEPSDSGLEMERTRIEEFVPDNARDDYEERNSLASYDSEIQAQPKSISHERTVVFQRSAKSQDSGKRRGKPREIIIGTVFALVIGNIGYDLFFDNSEKSKVVRAKPIRPQLPALIPGKSDPKKSVQIYQDAMKSYVADTVTGYKTSADQLRLAAGYDNTNVKALAMLASSYINLIDSSNKDENFFAVISQLIDRSRAKEIDLPETVVAEVEFFIVVHRAEAAQNRINEYTKLHPTYGFEMFYYLALTFYARGDYYNAAKWIGQIPDNKAFSAKIFYLRGLIAEKLKNTEAALAEYKKAIKFNPSHAKSYLRVGSILNRQGKMKDSAPYINFILEHTYLLPPKELALAYFLHAQVSELQEKWSLALADVERADKLDPENHEYLLELYTLRAKAGESLEKVKTYARMYYFLGEGERLIQLGQYQDALVPLLQAREVNDRAVLPLVKIGDMFNNLHDVENAKINYKLAADRAPQDIQVWSKYINVLIQSYEWEEAKKAMDKFRKLPVSQSAIDKAAADMYQKQGRFVEAQTFYRKAMGRDSIDPDVYIAYAKSLMSTKNYKDAPFFFAIALRFDPLNVDAVINTAKCIAETESIERGINRLQDELQQGTKARAEFLSAIAELQIQKGSWDQAQQNVEQAMEANPHYAYPWKLQAQIHMNREHQDKTALDKALLAYKSYSDRNASDPTGYLERYKIFLKKSEFEKANEELMRIYLLYPKYPKLHLYRGYLYRIQGNHVAAAEEFKRELANNPDGVETLISLGKELLDSGQAVEALKHFSRAMQLAPSSAEAKQNAGWANYRIKNYQAAETLLKAALMIDKANPDVHKRLGIVYRDMGDIPNACFSFRKYLEMEPDAPDKAEFQSCL